MSVVAAFAQPKKKQSLEVSVPDTNETKATDAQEKVIYHIYLMRF